jgi:DNA-binding ferritin-like protein
MFFMSGSQAHAYANAAQTMTERIRKLGPNPLKSNGRKAKAEEIQKEFEEEENTFRGRRNVKKG